MFEKSVQKAKKCLLTNDVPVYACVFEGINIVSESINTKEATKKVSGHAEINAINKAFKSKNSTNLSNYFMFTTLEPCDMCHSAINQSKIQKVYYLLDNKKFGYNSKLPVNEKNLKLVKIESEDLQKEYNTLLSDFFKIKR